MKESIKKMMRSAPTLNMKVAPKVEAKLPKPIVIPISENNDANPNSKSITVTPYRFFCDLRSWV